MVSQFCKHITFYDQLSSDFKKRSKQDQLLEEKRTDMGVCGEYKINVIPFYKRSSQYFQLGQHAIQPSLCFVCCSLLYSFWPSLNSIAQNSCSYLYTALNVVAAICTQQSVKLQTPVASIQLYTSIYSIVCSCTSLYKSVCCCTPQNTLYFSSCLLYKLRPTVQTIVVCNDFTQILCSFVRHVHLAMVQEPPDLIKKFKKKKSGQVVGVRAPEPEERGGVLLLPRLVACSCDSAMFIKLFMIISMMNKI